MQTKITMCLVLSLVTLITIAAKCDGDTQNIGATADCGEGETFESRLGIVNVPQLSIGDYFWVNWTDSSSSYLGRITYSPSSDVVTDASKDEVTIDYDADLEIAFDADLPETVESSLKTHISKSSELSAYNVQRRSLNNVFALANADRDAKSAISNLLERSPDVVIYAVHSVQNADSLSIGLASGSQSGASVSVVSFGQFKLTVTYQCNNTLGMVAGNEPSPVFFKVSALGYDAGDDLLFPNTAAETSLLGINMTSTLQ